MKLNELKKYSNKKVAILGFGKEGKSSLEFLLKLGFKNITVLDKNKDIKNQCNIKYQLGEEYLSKLGEYDLIFKSPGLSPYNELIKPYKNKLISQAHVFFDNYNGKVIGITGTKGKSTTSTLTYEILKKIGYKVKLVGNIGNPILNEVNIINNETYDFIIYELSSYMLEGLQPKLFIGVLNNLYDCHLDWHNGKENYSNAKYNILKYSKYKLVNYELKNIFKNTIDNLNYFGENGTYYYKNLLFYKSEQSIFKDNNIVLEGEHNRKNISAVVGILDSINTSKFDGNIILFREVLATFSGLPYRIENIGEYNGITFINDAIATTPESTIEAIKTYGKNIGTIFLGGQDSGFKFDKLKNTLEKYKIPNIVLFPDTGEKIFGDLSDFKYETSFYLKGNYSPKIFKTRHMKAAIDFAYKNTAKGKICILSTAAPSFSLWNGYIEKGNLFKEEVTKYLLN